MSADEELAQTFTEFDSDDDGLITAGEFRLAMTARGDEVKDDELDSIFLNADHDQDGRINLAEFTEAWNA
jgi:Ca2+-binding EF-hand superfamily protein